MSVEGAHLVGSVPLTNAEAVFRAVCGTLRHHLERLPDGETGIRKDWIAWQYAVLASTRGLGAIPVGDRGYLRRQLVRLTDQGKGLEFGPLGYADAALKSFAVFRRLKEEAVIPPAVRFQVSLPTPLAPMVVFVEERDRSAVEPAYQRRLLEELGQIAAGIPHDQLAIQWDVAVEVALLEGIWPVHFADPTQGVRDRLGLLARSVPEDVPVGFHLCYGDFGHRHFMSPSDASTLVDLANAIAGFDRSAAWIHMPIPVGWKEPGAYAPLAQLALRPTTHLYLGLIHLADGIEGALRRIDLASEVVPRYGVATECGWGRRPADTLPLVLQLHAAALELSQTGAGAAESASGAPRPPGPVLRGPDRSATPPGQGGASSAAPRH